VNLREKRPFHFLEDSKVFYSVISFLILVIVPIWSLGLAKQLWLDETWTLRLALESTSLAELCKSYSNHYITLLTMFFIGFTKHWSLYRIPAFLSGALALITIAVISSKLHGRLSAYFTLALFGTSCFLMVQSTEARGYTGVVFHSLVAYYLLLKSPWQESFKYRMLFALNAALGLLSLSIFVLFFAPAMLWCGAFASWKTSISVGQKIKHLFEMTCLPFILISPVFLLGGKAQFSATGDDTNNITSAINGFLQLLLEQNSGTWLFWVTLIVFLGFVLYSIVVRLRSPDWRNAVLDLLLLTFPLAGLLILNPTAVYDRHFATLFPFLYLCFASAFSMGIYKNKIIASLGLLAFAAVIYFNCKGIGEFLLKGRGTYLEVLEQIARGDKDNEITLYSDQPKRFGMVFWYYAHFIPGEKKFIIKDIFQTPSLEKNPARWIVLLDFEKDPRDPTKIKILRVHGVHYELQALYPKFSSGWNTYLYKMADRKLPLKISGLTGAKEQD
jgi:hypothetical protein